MDQVKFVEDSLKQTVLLQIFYRLSSTNFNWSILEYFDSYYMTIEYSILHNIPKVTTGKGEGARYWLYLLQASNS